MNEPASTGYTALDEALAHGRLRFFRAAGGEATGRTGQADTARFAEDLIVLQECALLLGEKLGMDAVASAVCHEQGETYGFCYDPNSNPQEPVVFGGLVNRRMPFGEFVKTIRAHIDT